MSEIKNFEAFILITLFLHQGTASQSNKYRPPALDRYPLYHLPFYDSMHVAQLTFRRNNVFLPGPFFSKNIGPADQCFQRILVWDQNYSQTKIFVTVPGLQLIPRK